MQVWFLKIFILTDHIKSHKMKFKTHKIALRSIDKKLVKLSRFLPLRGLGGGGWVDPLKKENLWKKYFFQIIWNWVLKNLWKMISADVTVNKNKKK